MKQRSRYLAAVTFIAVLLVLIPTAAAQEFRGGGTVVIEEGETVQGLTTTAGSVIVRGTVDGNLNVAAGNADIQGNVTGDTNIAAGDVTFAGTMGGNVTAFGGAVRLTETGSVGNQFATAADEVLIAGTVGSDARVDADSLRVAPTARIGGDLIHDTDTLSLSNESQIQGEIRSVDSIQFDSGVPFQTGYPAWAFSLYGFLLNLVLGTILLYLLPGYAGAIGERARDNPFTSLGMGVLTMILAPLVLFLLFITILGIPLAVVGLFLFLIALWLANIFGALGIGAAILGRSTDRTTDRRRPRWTAMLLGLFVVFLLGAIPLIGGLIHLVVTLIGLGAMALGARREINV